MKKTQLVFLLALSLLTPSLAHAVSEERSIEFLTPEGLLARGIVVYPGPESGTSAPYPLAVLVHHHGRTRDSLIPLADALAARGVASVLMDQRGHGKSRTLKEREVIYTFPILPESHIRRGSFDQGQVYDELAGDDRIDRERVAIVGVGIGALVAAEASWRTLVATDALVLVDPAAEIAGFRPTRDIGLFGDRPVLFVCSGLARSKAMSRRLAAYGHGPRDVQCVDDFEVTDRLLREGMAAVDLVADWVAESLAAESP